MKLFNEILFILASLLAISSGNFEEKGTKPNDKFILFFNKDFTYPSKIATISFMYFSLVLISRGGFL